MTDTLRDRIARIIETRLGRGASTYQMADAILALGPDDFPEWVNPRDTCNNLPCHEFKDGCADCGIYPPWEKRSKSEPPASSPEASEGVPTLPESQPGALEALRVAALAAQDWIDHLDTCAYLDDTERNKCSCGFEEVWTKLDQALRGGGGSSLGGRGRA